MTRQLTRDDLTSDRGDRLYKEIELPPPNPAKNREKVKAWIRTMFGCEYLDLINSLTDDQGKPINVRQENMGSLMVAFCWVDKEGGKPVMGDEDVLTDWWRRKHPGFLTSFIGEVRAFNGVGLGEVESEVKNLSASPSSETPTE